MRDAQLAQYNFILTVGRKEHVAGTVDVRSRDNERRGEHKVDALIAHLHAMNTQRCDDSTGSPGVGTLTELA